MICPHDLSEHFTAVEVIHKSRTTQGGVHWPLVGAWAQLLPYGVSWYWPCIRIPARDE